MYEHLQVQKLLLGSQPLAIKAPKGMGGGEGGKVVNG
jgi:hypothetical protein